MRLIVLLLSSNNNNDVYLIVVFLRHIRCIRIRQWDSGGIVCNEAIPFGRETGGRLCRFGVVSVGSTLFR